MGGLLMKRAESEPLIDGYFLFTLFPCNCFTSVFYATLVILNKEDICMKKFCKIFGFILLGIIVIAYLSFLFVLPNVVDINQFKPEVQKIAKEQSGLGVNFENAKIITTPLLGVGVKADNLSVTLPDNSILFSADNLKTRVALPSLALLTIKVSCFELNNSTINLEIVNGKQYKIISIIEDILNTSKEQKLEEGLNPEKPQGSWFNPAWIRIKVPYITLNNYKVLIKDLKTGHYLDLNGEQLKAGYFNGKTVKVKTYAELFSDKNKNITANVDIDTFLPPPAPQLDSEDDRAERIEIPLPNFVDLYRTYDLKANLDSKLRIRNGKKGFVSYGYIDLEGLTLKVSKLVIPESYFRAKTFGQNAEIDTNIAIAKNQNLELLGKLNYGKHPRMDMNIKSAEIKFNDLLSLGKAFLDSLNIKHEFGKFTATGSIKSDCYIKTNFKNLRSTGSVIVKNGGVGVNGIGQVIKGANVNVILDGSVLDIQNSSLYVNNSPVSIDGTIDSRSVADINIKADKIPLGMLFNAFAPMEMRQAYNFRSGDATFNIALNGKLKEAVATVKAGLVNLNISDRKNTFRVYNKKLTADFYCNTKELSGLIKNEELNISLPQTISNISIPMFEIEITEGNIVIKENKINFNNNSVITFAGSVINYIKPKLINFTVAGNISTEDLIKVIGREFKPFIHSSGNLPLKLTFQGDNKRQTLFAQILADKNNFITPVDFAELKDKNISLQSVVDFKGNRIKIKKTGFFTRNVSVDEKGNEVVTLDEVLGLDGTIMGNRINLIKVTMPNELSGKLHIFPRSLFATNGKAFIFGETSHPRMRGGFEIKNLSIPELLMSLRKGALRLRGDEIALSAEDLLLNGSDLALNTNFKLIQQGVFTLDNVNINSRYFNLDKVMKVSDLAMKYVPQGVNSGVNNGANVADIPLIISRGVINFARLITGNIDISNIRSRIAMRNNIFYLDNLRANAFKGGVNGDISVNLISMLLNIKLKGEEIDVEKAMLDACGMKGMLSGTAEFDTDISLSGTTMEDQMKSLKGNVNFLIKNGQFGPFGKLENLILAENIRESAFFQSFIGNLLSGLLTIDTTHFTELKGTLTFDDGICYIEPITSSGNILALHLFGKFDLLQNKIDMKVRARMASLVSNLLGPISAINPVNLVNSAASMNVVTAKAFSLFCEVAPIEEIEMLPSFANSYVDNSATKFQIVVRGDVAKPLTLVKSFKWLTTQMEFAKAKDFADSLPEQDEDSKATNIEELIEEHNSFGYKAKQFGKKIVHPFGSNK